MAPKKKTKLREDVETIQIDDNDHSKTTKIGAKLKPKREGLICEIAKR